MLLPPTPTSPDSLQTASGYFSENGPAAANHSFISSNLNSNARTNDGFGSTYDFANQNMSPTTTSGFASSNPFVNLGANHHSLSEAGAFVNANLEDDGFSKVSGLVQTSFNLTIDFFYLYRNDGILNNNIFFK